MKAINITKFNNRTEHFYVSFWNISSCVDIETIKSGYLTLHDNVFSNMGKDSNIFIPIKSTDEKNLMKQDIIK